MVRRLLTLASLVLVACGGAHKAAQTTTSPPPLLIDARGTTMPLEQVVTHISFRPFIPSAQVLGYAVLPPLGGLDNDATRGIGIEYLAGSQAMLLSQWPKQRFAVAFGHVSLDASACKPVHYGPLAVAWTTPNNLVLTLQPDGDASAAAVDREAARLAREGACR